MPIILKGKEVEMYADTGADISVMSKRQSQELQLDLVKTKMRIKPYGMKRRIKCTGYYVGPAMHGKEIANIGVYIVNSDVEALLSGPAAEALGILTFHGDTPNVRRCDSAPEEDENNHN